MASSSAASSNGVLNIKEAQSKKFNPHVSQWVIEHNANDQITQEDFVSKLPNQVMAHEYPFELDTFQKQAILCLENGEDVFVAAHTSAGKTVVAEYAISLSLNNGRKVFYTSPIKALSNQKFRDFKKVFGKNNVGILTGDVQINPESNIVVMTTEILLSMLYNNSDVINELDFVIFDEVHYCNDEERGHVWEKIFILLPLQIKLVLLSATVANIPSYADWLGRTRNSKINVISTVKRPVPLEHLLYTGKGSRGIEEKFLLVDSNSRLLQEGYRAACQAVKEKESMFKKKFGAVKGNAGGLQAEKNFYIGAIRHLEADDKLPAIIFTFSRKKADENARSISSAISLTSGEESAKIHLFINKSLRKLSPEDRLIKQVVEVIEMLKKGFGVHHSGVLPILKEITELLFTEGYIKILFATETFAMGINMPARTVAFDSTEKHDGMRKRNLLPSEYIQMAGRAGRRGKDKTGTVLILVKKNYVPELNELYKMALGQPNPLESRFRLTYSMILNLIRFRHNTPIESVMGKSFIEHEKVCQMKGMKDEATRIETEISGFEKIDCINCQDIDEFSKLYMKYCRQLDHVNNGLIKGCCDKKIIAPGRMVLYDSGRNPFTLGLILSYKFKGGFVEVELLSLDPMELMKNGPNII